MSEKEQKHAWRTDPKTGAKTLPLLFPVTHNGEDVAEVTFRRPKLRDLESAESKPLGGERDKSMYASLAQLEPELFSALDLLDWDRLGEMYQDFFVAPPAGTS